jgi:hypothetical protein
VNVIRDPDRLVREGLAAIPGQYAVPADFPPEVIEQAEHSSTRAWQATRLD